MGEVLRKVRRTEDVRRTENLEWLDLGVVGGFAKRAFGECGRQIAQGLVSHFTDFGFYTEASEKHLESLGS